MGYGSIAALWRLCEGSRLRMTLDRFQALWLLLCFAGLAMGCDQPESVPPQSEAESPIRFVGSKACAQCHLPQSERWQGSHHDRAMEEATPESVVGRFDGSTLRHFDQTWRFTRLDDEFVVELEEPGRPLERLRVDYTFGVEPLQQYLVARRDGRLQALPVAWDARPREIGGQRWFDLHPEERIPRDDPLHWERLAYNWNSQCAACHSTQFAKRYDEENDRFESRSAEIDVGCEACHGPGSRHVSIHVGEMGAPGEGNGFEVSFETWNPDAWQRESGARIASRVARRSRDTQLEVCAPCHSRRTQIVDTPDVGAAFLEGHRPRLLDPGLYFDDGQIRDEVYVWGSFLQSRMVLAGVRCNDCHDPHSLELRRDGNALCAGCHDRAAYDVKAHHGHIEGTEPADCVSCHMPERIYMQIDGRRDHSFPIPNPERSRILDAPDVCEGCHANRDSDWAQAQIDSWRGQGATRPGHWSDHLIRGTRRRTDPQRWLEIALESEFAPLVRANAWARYAEELDPTAATPPLEVLRERLRDGSSLERLAIIDVARRLAPEFRTTLLRPLLEDERFAIRASAAEALADLPNQQWRPADRAVLARALRDYRAAQQANAERPDAQANLGLLSVHYGELDAARVAYLRAIELAPYFVPAYANLADLERMLERDAAAVVWLRRAVELDPDGAAVRHALGLALHRLGEFEEALSQLAQASQTAPQEPRLVLGWALALDASGRREEAISTLVEAVDRGTTSADLQHALVALLRDHGELERARVHAEAWLRSWPGDLRARSLLRELEAASGTH